jgi:hypothetical protein
VDNLAIAPASRFKEPHSSSDQTIAKPLDVVGHEVRRDKPSKRCRGVFPIELNNRVPPERDYVEMRFVGRRLDAIISGKLSSRHQ